MNTDDAWTKWGDTEPYFGVLSDSRYRRKSLDSSLATFFESGERHVDALMRKIERTISPIERWRALDFGCGVGRLAIPLAKRFRDVVGVDVSTGMLAEAKRNVAKVGQRNISLVESDDTLSRVEGQYQLVNSYIVLQHIPVLRGMRIIRQLVDRVADGGVISIHVTVSHRGGPILAAKNIIRRMPGAQQIANLYNKRPLGEPMMQMNMYDLSVVVDVIASANFGPMLIEMEQHGRFNAVNIISRRNKTEA